MTDAELCHLLNIKEVHIAGSGQQSQPRPPCNHQIFEIDERFACKNRGQFFGWVSSYTPADMGDRYYKHHVWRKPKPPKSRKTLQKYNICFENGEAGEIEYKLNQVLNGKISRGKPLKALIAVCYQDTTGETESQVKDLIQVSDKHWENAMEKFKNSLI